MAEICCPKAVFDDQAGWWCPDHGDQWDVSADPDPYWREDPANLRPWTRCDRR